MPSKTAAEAKILNELADYLVDCGFAGDIPINEGAKNWRAIKKLVKHEKFYTFGIKSLPEKLAEQKLGVKEVRNILIADSGLDLKRFGRRGAGYFEPQKSAAALSEAMRQIKTAAQKHQRLIFATGHPGAMVGLYSVLAGWAAKHGARVVMIDHSVQVKERYYLDMIGAVFVPSDNASAWHSHETMYMDKLLTAESADLIIGDHGFVGSALNHGIASIGFYDTDDPAMPLAAHLGLPVTAVPINDNRYNANGAALGRWLVERLG